MPLGEVTLDQWCSLKKKIVFTKKEKKRTDKDFLQGNAAYKARCQLVRVTSVLVAHDQLTQI